MSPGTIRFFFLAPSEQLGGRTPLALLRDGEIAGAVALARSVAGDQRSRGTSSAPGGRAPPFSFDRIGRASNLQGRE